jgi:hypothetical protein
MQQLRHLVDSFSLQRPGFVPKVDPCGICGVQSGRGQVFFIRPSVSLSMSIHHCLIFTDVSSGGETVGPVKAQYHTDIVSPPPQQQQKNLVTSLKAPEVVLCLSLKCRHPAPNSDFLSSEWYYVSLICITVHKYTPPESGKRAANY